MLLGTIQAPPIKRSWIGFNPQRGFMLLGTPIKICVRAMISFNPQRGFMLLGTADSPPRYGCRAGFNPQRGFMLLGTNARFIVLPPFPMVSIPREDSCFWELQRKTQLRGWNRFNPQRGFMLLGTYADVVASWGIEPVSIPREDSCFWELPDLDRWGADAAFQSPERIHAFGNSHCERESRNY